MSSTSRPKRKRKTPAVEQVGRPLLRISRASTRRFERLEDRRLLASDMNFSLLATDLRSALSTVQTSIATAVNQAPSIPIIGASLGNNPGLTQAIGSKANSLQSGFQAVASDISANPAASDSIITGYVQSELASVATSILVTPDINADGTWRFEMQLHQDLAVATVHPQFDAGLGSYLSVSGGGSIDLKVGMDYLLQFTFDPTTSAIALESTNLSSINSSLPNAPLAIEISAAPSVGFSLDGRLAGLLHLSATNDDTQITGMYSVNIASPSQVNVALTASAHVGFKASLDFGTGDLPFNPKVTSKFHFDWSLSSTALTSNIVGTTFGNLTNVGFDDVSIDAGSFFGSYIGSLVKDIQHFTKPIQPIVDVLNTPIPGLSDLGLNVTLRSLLGIEGSGYDDALDAITAIDKIDPSSLGGTGSIDLGSFTLNDDMRLNGPAINTSDVAGDIMQQAETDGGNSLDQVGGDNSSGFKFPILSDPVHSMFAMLTGQDATLFSFTMPSLTVPLSVEIPILAIPPFAGLFADVSVAFSFDLSVGYDTHGLRELVTDTASGADTQKLSDDVLDGFYLDNSVGSDGHFATGFDITGGVSLAAKALVLKVSGGLFADVDLHLDPTLDDAHHHVRLASLTDVLGDGSDPFVASGSIYVAADFQVVIPAFFGDIVLADVKLAHITLVDFDSNNDAPNFTDNNTIFIEKSSENENISVKMQQLDPSIFATGYAELNVNGPVDPKAYVEAIVVSYPDHKESYPVGYYSHVNGNLVGENLEAQFSEGLMEFQPIANGTADSGWTPIHYHLVATTPALDILGDPEAETGNQTISVGDIVGDADGTPVNAVLIGGSGNDILEYQGHGKAVLIGSGGSDKLRGFNQQAQLVDEFGDEIDPRTFDLSSINFPMPTATSNAILAHVVVPNGSPAHTSNVLAGAGANVFLQGGGWDNFFESGSTTTYVGGAGQNEFKIEVKLADPNAPVLPGDIIANPTADNSVIIDRNGLPASVNDNVTVRAENGSIHFTGYLTDITISSTFTLAIDMDGGELDIGDMSPLGPLHILVNRGSASDAATNVLFATPRTGLPNPLEISERGPVDPVANPSLYSLDVLQGPNADQPGASLEMLGFTTPDSLDVPLYGGQVNIGDLNGTGMGLVKIDGSVRAADSTAVDDISITTHPENTSLAPDPNNNILVRLEDSTTPYDVEIDDDRPQDITTLIVPTQDLSNLATVDASEMEGTLHIDVGGATLTLLRVAENMTVIVAGTDQANPAEVTVGDSKLSHIESNVSVTGAELTIDNSTNTAPHIFTMTSNSYTGWSIPNSTFEPTIFLGNALSPLVATMTLRTAAGDRFDIEGTPPKVNTLVFDNASVVRNAIFVVAATSNMIINGDFDLYLGERLEPDGTSEREKHLTPISNVKITLNFTTVISGYASTIFDGDLDSPNTTYTIGGTDTLQFVNETIGLDVTIIGYRAQDQAYVYLPGGTVTANLTDTSPGTIYIDGQARLAGTNPDAPNAITASVRPGGISLTPTGTYDSVLQDFNTFYILGSKPQDSLDVTAPTTFIVAPRNAANNPVNIAMQDAFNDFDPFTVVNPPSDLFIILSSQLPITVGPGEPANLLNTGVLNGAINYDDTTITYASAHRTATVNIRVFPLNPSPAALDNNVALDASQLRGTFHFGADEPDYSHAEQIVAGNDGGNELLDARMITSFGQTHVNLTKVNPELSVSITGTGQISQANLDQLSYDLGFHANTPPINNPAATDMTLGAGDLANIQGNVGVTDLWLKEVDDRDGTLAGNLVLTGFTLSGWGTTSGTHPTLALAALQGDLTLTGSAVDNFGVEDTPNSALTTTIRNLATAGATPGVYVMGKTAMPLYIDGHLLVSVGRRLNADGSVTAVGQVDNLFNAADVYQQTGGNLTMYSGSMTSGLFDSQLYDGVHLSSTVNIVPGVSLTNYLRSGTQNRLKLPLFYNYVGNGQGTLVFDASGNIYPPSQGALDGAYEGITANPNYPTEADLRYRTVGDVIWGSNIETYDYAPAYNGNVGSTVSRAGPTEIINNPVNGEIHYLVNPNTTNSWQEVEVGATLGVVEVVGDDQFTRVDLDPAYSISIATIYNIQTPNQLPGWGAASGGGGNLLGTIVGDVTVRHAGLTIHADTASSTAPASMPQIVLTDTQITGIAGGTIHFSNLTQGYSQATQNSGIFANQFPGLVVRMPTYGGVSVQVQNTPGNTTTELNTETNEINDLTVLGTTGTLELANVTFASGSEYASFAANSVTIGNGNLSAIAGAIYLGAASLPGHLTIDDRSDATSRQATFKPVPSSAFFALAGLSPAAINVNSSLNFPHFDIYGAAASTYSFQWAPQNTRLFAGAGSSVELTQSTFFNYIAPVSVFGAGSVLIDLQVNPSFTSGNTVNVAPDPTRPTDTTDLTIDFTKIPVNGLKLGSVGSGVYALFGNGNNTQGVAYQGAMTHLTLLLYSQTTTNNLPVTDTASGGTTISPGDYALNVQGTSGPLTIEQGGTGAVTLGNSGSLTGIQGAVSILANNSALPVVPLTIDDSADTANKTVTLSQDGSGNTQISGELATPIQITGSQFSLNLKGGSGNNQLVAPNVVDVWQVPGANSGVLNRTITFSGFGNLQSGNQNDNIFFKPGGSLSGNLDGGPGTDTLYYQAGMLTGSDVINLPAHIAPRVNGQALNIESSNTFSVLTISNPGQLIVQVNAPMTPVTITSTGGSGTKTFSATGLPTGVAINPSTGVISGTNTTDFYAASVVVTATDDTGSVSTSFGWNTSSGLILTTPPDQSSQVSQIVNVPIHASYTYGGTLTYSATSLPNGLSINSQTGVISGTIADGAQTSSPYSVFVKATDGTNSAFAFFNWTVLKSFAVVNPGTQLFPENLPVNLQMQAVNGNGPITYSASNLPASLSIDPHTGLISGILADYADSSGNFVNFSVTVFANDTHQTVSTAFTFGTEPGFQVTGVYDQTNRSGDVVDNFLGAFNADGNATVTTSVSGLPAGLTYNNSIHLITGTIAANADTASPYTVTVTFNNQTFGYTASESFHWTVTPAIVMASPGDQNSIIGDVVDVPIAVTEQFGQPITFSAESQLPLGLSVDPNTGTISGTIGPQLNSSSDFTIDIHATDGTVDGDLIFNWHIGQTTANVAEIYDPTSGGTVILTSPVGTILTAQIDSEESSNDSANIWSFPLGYITLSVQGVAPGDSANVEMHSSTLINPTDYFVDGPTPANNDYHWYDFLYQHPTDTDDASTTGAEFLPNRDIVLHLVDGARGDSDLTADGQINLNLDGPTALALSARIVGGPRTWPIGTPLTLGSEIGGSAALGASLHWQAFYTPDFQNYINLPNGADSTYTLNPQEAGFYYVYLTATSADGTISATDYNFNFNVPATTAGTPPIGGFAIAGIPSDILAGHSISGTILAEDANGNSLEGYTGPISIRISDSQNNTIDTISGNFDPSTFTFGPISLQNTGNSPTTDTITITAGNTTVSLPIVVHPVSRFVSTQNSLAVDAETPFGVSFITEDDRSVFDSDYSGSAKLTYVDNQGEHDLSGGFQAVSGGVVTFQNVVLPSGGIYHLQATGADGKVVGSFFVDSHGIDLSAPVMNTADGGAGSLRQALLDAAADTSGEQYTIQFALPAGPQTITLQSPLPTPTDPLMLSLDATQKVTIVGSSPTAWNNTQSFTVAGVGSLTFVGGIEGTGNLVVDAGSNLTADSIVQNSLSIGAGATVTIAPSGGSMNASTAAASTTDVAATSAPSQVALARLAAVRAQRLAALLLAESSVSTDSATAPIEVAPTAVANTTDAIAPALTIGPAVSILSSKTPVEASVAATIIPPTITLTNNSLATADVSSSVSRLTVKTAPPLPQRQSTRSSAGQSASLLTQVTFDQLFHQIPSDLTSKLPITAWNWQDVSGSPATSRAWSATAFAGDGVSSNDSPKTSLGAGGLDPNAVREAIDTIFATDDDVAWRFDDSRWALLADGASNSD